MIIIARIEKFIEYPAKIIGSHQESIDETKVSR
jgi:hypothetical protein